MKKLFVTLVVAPILAGSVTPYAVTRVTSAQAEVALLMQLEGDVRVQRGRRTQRAGQDMLLNVGDVVSVNGTGTVVIYQAYVPVTRLGPNQRFKVERRSPPPSAGALTSEEFTWLRGQYVAARRNRRNPSPRTMGRPEDTPLALLEPRNSVVLTRRPTFAWSRVADATKYVVNIYDAEESVVCAESTAETRLALPERCQPLCPGDYKWDVTAHIGKQVSDNPAHYDAAPFTVVTDRRAAELNKALEHARAIAAGGGDGLYVYVSALMESKLYPQAEAELRRALEQSPKDQALWALLIETYAQMKHWRAREKAKEMSSGNPTAEMVRALEPRR
jgi:hypothetical protein